MTAPSAAVIPPAPVPGAGTPMLVVDGLVKRFRTRRGWRDLVRGSGARWGTAVAGVGFEAREGELLAILGANGAGKTTLFRMIAGLILPDEGRISIAGIDAVAHPGRTRPLVGAAFADERSLHWRLTAEENLRLWAGLNGMGPPDRDGRVLEALSRVELERTGRALVGTFSSGMKQRLLIARALLTRPRLLLLDEPTRSLDPLSARALRRFVRDELVDRERCTVLLATHNGEEALGLCDRVLVLDRGTRVALAPPSALGVERGEEQWIVVTRAEDADAVRASTGGVVAGEEPDGWVRVAVTMREGHAGAAALNAALTSAGHQVARIERAPFTLADVLERLVGSAR